MASLFGCCGWTTGIGWLTRLKSLPPRQAAFDLAFPPSFQFLVTLCPTSCSHRECSSPTSTSNKQRTLTSRDDGRSTVTWLSVQAEVIWEGICCNRTGIRPITLRRVFLVTDRRRPPWSTDAQQQDKPILTLPYASQIRMYLATTMLWRNIIR